MFTQLNSKNNTVNGAWEILKAAEFEFMHKHLFINSFMHGSLSLSETQHLNQSYKLKNNIVRKAHCLAWRQLIYLRNAVWNKQKKVKMF